MRLNSNQFGQCLLVTWFVLLQILIPFLHAHTNGQSAHASHGIHLHQTDLVIVDSENASALLKAPYPYDADAMVIGVGNGIKEQANQILWIALFFSFLLLPIFTLPLRLRLRWQKYVLAFISIRQRTCLNPRAPPYA